MAKHKKYGTTKEDGIQFFRDHADRGWSLHAIGVAWENHKAKHRSRTPRKRNTSHYGKAMKSSRRKLKLPNVKAKRLYQYARKLGETKAAKSVPIWVTKVRGGVKLVSNWDYYVTIKWVPAGPKTESGYYEFDSNAYGDGEADYKTIVKLMHHFVYKLPKMGTDEIEGGDFPVFDNPSKNTLTATTLLLLGATFLGMKQAKDKGLY